MDVVHISKKATLPFVSKIQIINVYIQVCFGGRSSVFSLLLQGSGVPSCSLQLTQSTPQTVTECPPAKFPLSGSLHVDLTWCTSAYSTSMQQPPLPCIKPSASSGYRAGHRYTLRTPS